MDESESKEHVTETNDHAANAKLSAVNLGYYDDPFLRVILPYSKYTRCSPEMHKGYALRVIYMRNLIKNFVKRFPDSCQIVSLGSGFDTLYWNLQKDFKDANFVLFETDFSSVVMKKAKLISCRKELGVKFTRDHNIYSSPKYKLFPCDLRELDYLKKMLESSGFDGTKPTIIFAECVLVYMDDKNIRELIQYFGSSIETGIFFNYDPMNFSDKFGEIMQKNVNEIEYDFRGIETCGSLEAHRLKYLENGWDDSIGYSLWDILTKQIPTDLKKKFDSVEFLDEVNLLEDLLTHYCVCLGYKNLSTDEIHDLLSF